MSQVVPTLQVLASVLGISITTAKAWSSAGMPKLPDGYDVDAVRRWRSERGDGRTRDGALSASSPIHEEVTAGRKLRNRKAELETMKLALELRKMRGELVERSEFIDALRARATAIDRLFRSRARRLAEKCANRSAAEVFQLLHADTTYMTEVYRKAPTLAEVRDPDADEDLEPAPGDE